MPRFAGSLFFLVISLFLMSDTTRANPWQDLARADLEAIRSQIDLNHPGAVDPENPGFRDWLETGFGKSEAVLDRVQGLEDYFLVLKQYVAGFRDPHVAIDFSLPEPDRKWPGFIVAGRQGKVLVVESPSNSPPVGAELVNCDGVALETLLAERVFRFRANSAISASFDAAVRHLFFAAKSNLGSAPPLRRCLFRFQGQNLDTELNWPDVSPTATKLFDGADGNAGGHPTLLKADGRIYWMKLPSFSSAPVNRSALEQLFVALNRQQADIAASPGLVIDLRGNGGGSSVFGEILTYLLFDQDTMRRHAPPSGSMIAIDWRASEDNLGYARGWLDPDSPRHQETDTWTKQVIAGLEMAINAGQPFFRETVPALNFDEDPATLPYWRQKTNASDDKRPVFISPVPMHAHLFVLTDGTCFSACLDFLDLLKRFDGITYLGLPTSADTQYMDTRSIVLPSQLATLTLPMKVYRNRQRQPGESYIPDILYDGLDRREQTVRHWAEKTVLRKIMGEDR